MSSLTAILISPILLAFSIACRLIHLPPKQYELIESIILHWVNREYDYELYYDIDVGFKPQGEVRLSMSKCEYCLRIVNTDNNKGHNRWCRNYV